MESASGEPRYTNLDESVPGLETRPNTRRSDLVLEYGTVDQGRWFAQQNWLDREDDPPAQAHLKGVQRLAELAPLAPGEGALGSLRRRFEAHPLACQLPGCVEAAGALVGSVDADALLRACARSLNLGGFARALAAAARGGCGGEELRRYAAWGLVVGAGQFDLFAVHDGHGRIRIPSGSLRSPIAPLPRYAGGKSAGHDGGDHDQVCLGYDAAMRAYLARVVETVEEALVEATPGWFDQGFVPSRPEKSMDWREALSAYQTSGPDSPYDLRLLFGQPRDEVAAAVLPLLEGRSPAASSWDTRDRSAYWLAAATALALAR